MALQGVPHGKASLYLTSGVAFLREEETVFEAMIEGWAMQQRGGRGLKKTTVRSAANTVHRFQKFVQEWPWEWSAAGMDEWMTHLVAVKQLAPTTVKTQQQAVKAFCDYLCSDHYGWVEECIERFGSHPVQICHDWNTRAHLQDYEGKPGRRALTREELQALFDHADNEVERILASGRKGALPAFRDATLMKVVYAWGLRANEAVNLDITDFFRNAHAPQFGDYGILQVRFGKSSRGGTPKRRSVISLRPWAVDAVQHYVEEVLPLMRTDGTPALWLSERGTRLRTRELSERFAQYRDELGLAPELTPHGLRRSYATHLTEEGVDPKFVQNQMGHEHASTTSLYVTVTGDFANTMMDDALQRLFPKKPTIDKGDTQ